MSTSGSDATLSNHTQHTVNSVPKKADCQNTLNVRVHLELLPNIVQTRHDNNGFCKKRKGYRVNRAIRSLAAFYTLKCLTNSGFIVDYPSQLAELCTILNCVPSVFYARLQECQEMGLLTWNRKSKCIELASYNAVCEYFGTTDAQLVEIKYNYATDKLYHLMELAFIESLQEAQRQKFYERAQADQGLMHIFLRFLNITTKDISKLDTELLKYQVYCFTEGHEYYDYLMRLNPDFNCNARTLRKKFNFKSYKSVAFLKKKLSRLGLLTVERRPAHTSKVRSRLTTNHYRPFNQQVLQTKWKLPDALTVRPERRIF